MNEQNIVVEKKTNGFAIAGFILSIFTIVLGLIFSIIGICFVNKYKSGKGLSIAGIIISCVKLILFIVFIFIAPFILIGWMIDTFGPEFEEQVCNQLTKEQCVLNDDGSYNCYGLTCEFEEKQNDEEEITDNELSKFEDDENNFSIKQFNEIKFKDIKKLSNNKEIIIFIGRQGCSWCSLYAPIIESVSKEYNIKVYYLDFGKMVDFTLEQPVIIDENSYEGLIDLINNSEFASEISNGIGTPMTLFVKDNKLVNMIGGYVEEDNLKPYLEEEGFIK